MFKSLLAILLSSIFTIIIVLPTLVIAFDNSVDVSMFYTSSEEEKDKNQEKNKELEFIVVTLKHPLENSTIDFTEADLEYYFKAYKKPHIKLTFPPPKTV